MANLLKLNLELKLVWTRRRSLLIFCSKVKSKAGLFVYFSVPLFSVLCFKMSSSRPRRLHDVVCKKKMNKVDISQDDKTRQNFYNQISYCQMQVKKVCVFLTFSPFSVSVIRSA